VSSKNCDRILPSSQCQEYIVFDGTAYDTKHNRRWHAL